MAARGANAVTRDGRQSSTNPAPRHGASLKAQAVFATFLNMSVSTVQKWESPAAGKHPSGAAAKLLQLVETKGVEALIV